MRYFNGLNTVDAIRHEYKKLCLKLHPDKGGTHEGFLELQKQYHMALGELDGHKFYTEDNKEYTYSYSRKNEEEIMSKIVEIFEYIDNTNLEVMLMGVFIWIFGDTKPYREQFKSSKFFYSRSKQAWYWYPSWFIFHRSKNIRALPRADIELRYGSEKLEKPETNQAGNFVPAGV